MEKQSKIKTAFVIKQLFCMKDKLGPLIPKDNFLKFVIETSKKCKIKLTQKEIEQILDAFFQQGIICYPKIDCIKLLIGRIEEAGE